MGSVSQNPLLTSHCPVSGQPEPATSADCALPDPHPAVNSATVRGVLAIAAGIALLVWPEASLSVMAMAAAGYFIADGSLTLLGLLTAADRRWRLPAQGVVSLTIGVLVLLWPGITATALLYLLALWVIVMGAFRLHNAVQITDRIDIAWVPAILSILSIVAGATALTYPIRDVGPVLNNIGIFLILHGISLIASSRTAPCRQPGHAKHQPKSEPAA